MLGSQWELVVGWSNMDEADDRIAARKLEDNLIEVAYFAYSGVKVIEIQGIKDILNFNNGYKDIPSDKVGEYYEIALRVQDVNNNNTGVIVVDDFGECSSNSTVTAEVVSEMEYDADEVGELDEALLRIMELIEE